MTEARYASTAILLHWIVAALVLAQFALGWSMIEIPKDPPGARAGWFNLHKSIGMSIGLLAAWRIAWRLRHPALDLPASLPQWQTIAARINHLALYLCLVVMPVSGFLGSTFSGYPIRFFGLALPRWGWKDDALKDLCSQVHYATVCVFMALVALHVAAALKHLLMERDGVFQRMWPWRIRRAAQ